jgi:hypothetical protein
MTPEEHEARFQQTYAGGTKLVPSIRQSIWSADLRDGISGARRAFC